MAQTSFLLSGPPAENELSATAQETHCEEERETEADGGAQEWGEDGENEEWEVSCLTPVFFRKGSGSTHELCPP